MSGIIKLSSTSFIDLNECVVMVDGRRLNLLPTELKLLEKLIANQGTTVNYETIIETLWGDNPDGLNESSIKHHIRSLRNKIGDNKQKIIITRRGLGYMFELPHVQKNNQNDAVSVKNTARTPVEWVSLEELFFSEPDLNIEKNIWIVLDTLSIELDLINKGVAVSTSNLRKGICYTYFVYDTEDNRRIKSEIEAIFSDYRDQLFFCYVSINPNDSNHFHIPFYGLSFYNPDSSNSETRKGYEGNWYYGMQEFGGFRLHDVFVRKFIAKLQPILDEQKGLLRK